MDHNKTGGSGAGPAKPLGLVWRRSLAVVASFALVLSPAAQAQDGRTVLTPGWNMFSPEQDVEVGREVSADAERQLPMLGDSRVDSYVNNLGRRLAERAPGEEYPYTFKVVNDRAINAFALPGGPIYINRGVIEAADNESHLAGVIAHEISHVALRHGTNQASKASAAQLPLAILGGLLGSDSTTAILSQLGASFAVNSILLKYSRTAESQADIMGTQILYDSGYDPRAMGQFFEKIEDQQEGGGPVEFFSNHPSPENRIERVNEEVDALGGVRRDVTTNSGDFETIKSRLQSTPTPRAQESRTVVPSGEPDLLIVSARYGAIDRRTGPGVAPVEQEHARDSLRRGHPRGWRPGTFHVPFQRFPDRRPRNQLVGHHRAPRGLAVHGLYSSGTRFPALRGRLPRHAALGKDQALAGRGIEPLNSGSRRRS